MLHLTMLETSGVLYARCVDPFDLDDVGRILDGIAGGRHPGTCLAMPTILDARGVRLAEGTGPPVSRIMLRLKVLGGDFAGGPFVGLASDLSSMGRLRLYCILAHMARVRDERRTLVTDSFDDGIDWLSGQLRLDTGRTHRLTDEIQRIARAA